MKHSRHLIPFYPNIFYRLGLKTKANTGAGMRCTENCTEISITICFYDACTTFKNINNLEQ